MNALTVTALVLVAIVAELLLAVAIGTFLRRAGELDAAHDHRHPVKRGHLR